MPYRPTIGLEIHAELKTRTKMFCDSANNPHEAQPNANVCPICMAHPGTLPTINKEAVRHVLRVGAAIGGTIADYSEFDRKSYFYPDIPKGYQISQYQYPLVSGGSLADVAITRVHLEEDTARSSHAGGASLVDFNRAGVPLMELVTEPVLHDAESAGRFARELQLLLRTLGASDANLEKGEMRVEANISVSPDDTFGTKVEVKNLNSFRSVERAIAFEIERQCALLDAGEAVTQETRGFDEDTQRTFSQRLKEGSADYRYFPEPDLPKLVLSEVPEFSTSVIVASLPELPWQRRDRYARAFALKPADIEFLLASTLRTTFFDAVAEALGHDRELVQRATNYIVSDLAGYYAKQGGEEYALVTPESFAALIRMTAAGELSSRGAKDVLAHMASEGGDPQSLARTHGLLQASDRDALARAVDGVLAAHPDVVGEYRAGKQSVLQFLIGQAMRETKGAGNPALLREILVEKLGT